MTSPRQATFGRIFKQRRQSSGEQDADGHQLAGPTHGRSSSIDRIPRSHRSILASLTHTRRTSLDSQSPKRWSTDLHFPTLSLPIRRKSMKHAEPGGLAAVTAVLEHHAAAHKADNTPPSLTPRSSGSSALASSVDANEPIPIVAWAAPDAPVNLPITTLADVANIGSAGDQIHLTVRIAVQRKISSNLSFMVARDHLETIQIILKDIPTTAIRTLQRLRPETLASVTGTLVVPPAPITGTSIHTLELHLQSLHVISAIPKRLPLSNYRPPDTLRGRMASRVVDLRHPSNIALFKARAAVTRVFREVLDAEGFVEINTPKLQPAATESGAEVFKVDYFGRRAFLAQSPQLAKQMAIGADFGRVFEIGPVFRAENSNTHRHLTEYTGLDLEMTLPMPSRTSHHELLFLLDRLLKTIINTVQAMPEIAAIRERWPSTDIVTVDPTPIIPFPDAIKMLRADGADIEMADLSTKDEIRLGELVKAKYGTDLYILDTFPASARPFYAKRLTIPSDWKKDPELAKMEWTNGFDIFLRGQEISSGGQRIHDPAVLRRSMKESGIAEAGMEEYLSAFDAGISPHGGAGFGLERIMMLLLNLGDIRYASLFYRDPRSLPVRPPTLPFPAADTTKRLGTVLPLEDLIANYGASTNTSWLDERFEIWRHTPTGAAIGFVRQGKLAIIAGDPLCDSSQYAEVITAFLSFLKAVPSPNTSSLSTPASPVSPTTPTLNHTTRLTPVWLLTSTTVQNILANSLNWRSLTCTEEQRIDTHHVTPPQKTRKAAKISLKTFETKPTPALIARINPLISAWHASRKGKQIHLTQVDPWSDTAHRRYFIAETPDRVHALVVLAQLAPRNGWQVKWALDFPGAANGAIESLISLALTATGGPATFGAGASKRLVAGNGLGSARIAVLSRSYSTLVEGLGLARKTGFREKFGVYGESLWICFPRGVGVLELKGLIKFFED